MKHNTKKNQSLKQERQRLAFYQVRRRQIVKIPPVQMFSRGIMMLSPMVATDSM